MPLVAMPYLPPRQVGAFDIELVYVLALILYLAGLLHIDTRHTFEHITDRAVLSLGKGCLP